LICFGFPPSSFYLYPDGNLATERSFFDKRMSGYLNIQRKLQAFKRKYYSRLFVRGFLLTAGMVCAYFLIATAAEYVLWLSSTMRFMLLLLFIVLVIACIFHFLRQPLVFWLARSGMSDEQAARYIGELIPVVRDRLINLIQLSRLAHSPLAQAGMMQRAQEFEPLVFEKALPPPVNRKYLRFIMLPVLALVALLIFHAQLITTATYRIVHFRQQFIPEAPFSFLLQDPSLIAFRNEDYTLEVHLAGIAIPDHLYLVTERNRYKLHQSAPGKFFYVIEKIQHPVDFHFEAAGYRSINYHLHVADRPELEHLRIDLKFPTHIRRSPLSLFHAGPLLIPEGTEVTWIARGLHTEKARLGLDGTNWISMQNIDNQLFNATSVLLKPGFYEIVLENEWSVNQEQLRYPIDIIKDQYPEISVTHIPDSVYYKQMFTGGVVTDDYGITEIRIRYQLKTSGKESTLKSFALPVAPNTPRQNFYLMWRLDTLHLKPGDELTYYVEVFDNDGVNGRKSTRSGTYTLRLPDREEVFSDIVRSQERTGETAREGVEKTRSFRKELDEVRQNLKGKQSLDWQDKKRLEDLLERRKSIDELLKKLNDENRSLENKKDAFTEQDERIREKARQLQKLLDELLDDETRKLLEELQRLLRENARMQDVQRLLDQLNRNSKNLEKEMERTYELLRRIQFESRLDQTIDRLNDIVQQQKNLLDETRKAAEEGRRDPSRGSDLAAEQEKLKSAFEETGKQLEELEKMAEELGEKEDLINEEQLHDITEQLNESQENLQQYDFKKAQPAQQKAIEKMQDLKQKLTDKMEGAMMELNMENLESLRHILHGLIKLSFDQENILTDFRKMSNNDPAFNLLAQRQLKLQDDIKVLEDSLLALASRDPMMGSFVTREVTDLQDYIQKAIEANREKRRGPASTAMQQSMTAMNNLALMLDSHYDAMMQMMAQAKPSRTGRSKGKQPRLSELQQQLNQKIEELKNSGKQGRQLSEELARLAAEQERIRKALQEFEEQLKKEGGKLPGDGLSSQMEETELDLVNKQLTEELIQRQREILTRLLEAEQSIREQDEDEERKGETARDYEKIMPKVIEDYLKKKEKETEMLRTMPPRLHPYYQREIDGYIRRLRDKIN
jgi:ABC-type transporter Mla subunit MlaD